jgi:hypothetical protein
MLVIENSLDWGRKPWLARVVLSPRASLGAGECTPQRRDMGATAGWHSNGGAALGRAASSTSRPWSRPDRRGGGGGVTAFLA